MSTDFHTPHPSGANLDAAVFNTVYSDLDAAIRKGGAVVSASDPTAGDDVNDGYVVGTLWVNTARNRVWQCVDNTAADASWVFVAGEVNCEVYNSGNLSIPNASDTTQTFDTEITDSDGMFPGSGGTFTVPFDGVYQVKCSIRWDNNATDYRSIIIANSGALQPQHLMAAVSGAVTKQTITDELRLSAGNTISFTLRQTSGGALNSANEGTIFPAAAIRLKHGYINRK